jgi:hypothetical protein
MAESPFEMLAGPAEVYVAPVGESFPAINAVPAGNWVRLGRTKGGVGAQHNQTQKELRADQDTAPAKISRTEESMVISFALMDLTLENFAKVLNNVAVVDTPPGADTAGFRAITLYRGPTVAQIAMLIRAPSPYLDVQIAGESLGLDYRLTRVCQSGNPAVKYLADDAAVLDTEWKVISDPNAATPAERFGHLVAMDAAPTG